MSLVLEAVRAWPYIFLLILVAPHTWSAATSKIRHLPGPFIARFSRVWRISKLCFGHASQNYRLLHEKYGPVVCIGPSHVSLSDPSTIRTLYDAQNTYHKNSFYNVWKPLYRGESFQTIVTAPHSSEIREMKNMLHSSMTGDPLSHVKIIEDSLHRLTNCMRVAAGEEVNFFLWPYYWAFDMTFAMVFGEYLGFMEHRTDIKGIAHSIINISRNVPTLGMLPELVKWTTGNDWFVSTLTPWAGLPDLFRPLFEEIEKRIDAHGDPDHVCNNETVLCRIMQKEKVALDQSKRDQIVIVLFEAFYAQGMDIAVTLRSLFYTLLTDRHEYDEVTRLVRNCYRHQPNDTATTTYLNAVITETLRLYPTMAIHLERLVPEKGLYTNGYYIPPGTTVSTAHSVTHVDETVFGHDAHIFRPARWVDVGVDPEHMARMKNCLMTFGKGSRICPGKDLAMLALRMLMTEIFSQFRVDLVPQQGPIRCRAFWFTELEPLHVRFEPYENQKAS